MSSNRNVPNSLKALGVTRLNIEDLILHNNNLTSLPPEIDKLINLKRLYLSNNNLTSLPESIGKLTNLKELYLMNNQLERLPPSIGNLTNLEKLYLGFNKLKSLPRQIGDLTNLKYFDLRGNILESLPSSIGDLTNLEEFYLNHNKLTSLPESIGNLTKLRKLDLRENPNLTYINANLYYRNGLSIYKSSSTKNLIPRKNVPLNTNRNDPFSGYNFSVGNNALNLGYNRYLTENSLLKWIKKKNPSTNITSIITLYYLSPNTEIVSNPFTRKPLFRRNLNFVKFVKPPPTKKNNNKPPTNKNNNKPPTKKQKTGNAARGRRTNRNNNIR